MGHFNNFTGYKHEKWEIMQEFSIPFKNQEFLIQLIGMFHHYPEYYFFIVKPEEKACLMSKFVTHEKKIIWNSKLNQEESGELAELIKEKTGLVLPEKHNNNPFEYKGDIDVQIYCFNKTGVTVRKAKAPFGNDIFYQIIFEGGNTYSFGKFHFLHSPPEGEWYPVEPLVDIKEFTPLISLVETCNLYNRWHLEEPKSYTRYYKQFEK